MPLNAIEWEIKPWDTIVSRWGIEAWPHVGFLTEEAPDEFILNNEVARAEWFPLTALFNRENWGRRTLARRGAGRVLQSLPIWEAAEPCVWGMTAAFLSLFLDRVRGEAL